MKNILLTGSTGFIGSHLQKKLLQENYKVYSITRSQLTDTSNIEFVYYDGTFESIKRGLENKKIDSVIHLATLFLSQHKSEQINDLMSANITFGTHLIEWMSANGVSKFINVGTYAQFFEGSSYSPQNLYAATKSAFEQILQFYLEKYLFKVVNLYFYDSYGPKDTRPKLINLILSAIKNNQPLNMSPGHQEINYVYVSDVVSAILLGLERLEIVQPATKENYCVYSNQTQTIRELVSLISKTIDIPFSPNFGAFPYRDREIKKFCPRFSLLPNWKQTTSLEEGIKILWKDLNNENQ
jgi:CDP-paratose synthetase